MFEYLGEVISNFAKDTWEFITGVDHAVYLAIKETKTESANEDVIQKCLDAVEA